MTGRFRLPRVLRAALRRAEAPPDPPSATVLRLAVLLQAGIAPAGAWRYLARAGDADAERVITGYEEGSALAERIAALGAGWSPVSAAWSVATVVGAPLADALRAMAAALRDADEGRDEIRVALAEPAATSRLMTWLPLLSVALGVVLGFDTLAALASPMGVACAAAGVTLMIVARRWTGRMVAAAQPPPGVPGLYPELVAIALTGGVSLERAQQLAAAHESPDAESSRLLTLSGDAGIPAVELLRAAATLERHRSRTEGRLRAAALATRLMLPLGVCVLPAFMALGVAPLVLGILGTTPMTV